MTNIIIPIVAMCILGYLRLEELEQERNWKKCEETDWNEYYAS